MSAKLISVGFEIPGYSSDFIQLKSEQSVLDYDIIVFSPDISEFISYSESYQGKPSLHESRSFQLNEAASRWRKALAEAVAHGKTVFVFMSALQDVFVDTGQRQYSGTGRNRQQTNIVAPFNNYSTLPIHFTELVSARGKEIKSAGDLRVVSEYWAQFREYSGYELYFSAKNTAPLLVTRTGSKVVGGIIKDQANPSSGSFVLLPPISFDRSAALEKRDGNHFWTAAALEFGSTLQNCFVGIDEALRLAHQLTPPPAWAGASGYRLKDESAFENAITTISDKIEALQSEKTELSKKLEATGSLRRLLFEKGSPLEEAILDALRIFGVEADRYHESGSEFDAFFIWRGRRILGEAEGKDNKPINIDKISQLERNLGEDFAREDVTEYAKGVLFGNAWRLQKPDDRADFFTEKCVAAAQRIKAALVRTPDLFAAARHAKENGDRSYAEQCLDALLDAEGTLVKFPSVPNRQVPKTAKKTK